jgi:predicted DNA-binding protein with PD1-like motif
MNMIQQSDGHNYLIRFTKDELLIEGLQAFMQEKQLPGAWISGLGGAQWVELGFYDLPNQRYQWRRFDELLEVTAITGNIAWQNQQPVLHLHGTFSGQDYQAIGGHIKELCVGGTLELLIQPFGNQPIQRQQDNTTGLKLLAL